MDMRIKTIIFFLALVSYAPCFAQLSIEACYEKARANYPLIKQYGLIEKTKEYNLSNRNIIFRTRLRGICLK